jgi:hypothetical protein
MAAVRTARRRGAGFLPRAAAAALLVVGIQSVGALPAHAEDTTPHYEGTYTVHKDGSISMTEVQTVPKDLDCPNQNDLDDEIAQMDDPPKSIKPVSGNGRCGYTATWKTVPMSKLKTAGGLIANVFTDVRRDGSELDLTINNKLVDDSSDTKVAWTYVFPEKIERADGATIDGNRATWSDMRQAPRQIHIQGHLEKDFPWLAVILGAAGAVVVVAAVIVILVLLRRKRNKATPPQPTQWGPPPAPGQPLPPSVPPNQHSPWQGPPPQA